MKWGPDSYSVAANKLVDQYNASSGVRSKVAYQLIEWSSWPEIFFLAVSEGQAPDISTGGGYQAVHYYSRGEILPVDDVVAELTKGDNLDYFLPGSLERMVYDGHIVGLPWSADLRLFYFRQDLFAKAHLKEPTTWAELEDAAAELSQHRQYGFVIGGADTNAMHFVLALLFNNNGGLFSSEGKLDLMNARNVEALQFFSRLVARRLFNPQSLEYSVDAAQQQFFGDGGAIVFGRPGLHHEHPDQIDKIGVLLPPAGPHGDKGTISWIENIMVYRQGEHPDATKEFLKWWSLNQEPLWTEGHCRPLPVRASFVRDPYFQSDPIVRRMIQEWLPVGKSAGFHATGVFPALNEVEGYGPITTLCRDILQGKDAIAALQLANARMKAVLAPYGIESV